MKKIMVVEDSRMYQAMLRAYIEAMGFQVVSALNGDEALTVFQQERPELILLDINMPGMNGFETAKKIRAQGEEWAHWVPIIFLSSSQKDEDIVQAVEAGGDDFLIKPCSEMVLQAKIKAMLRMAEQRHKAIKLSQDLMQANEELAFQSKHDGMTGIANKRYFNDYLQQQWQRCKGESLPLSLLFMDVDHFKSYNDNYGHFEGDVCLKAIAQALNYVSSREGDIAFRYGGEEFALILPDMDEATMFQVGEQVVQTIAALKLPHAFSSAADIVTVSVGGATIVPHELAKSQELIKHADLGVYQAKEQGRNRFRHCAAELVSA